MQCEVQCRVWSAVCRGGAGTGAAVVWWSASLWRELPQGESSADLGAQARGIKWLPQKVTSYAVCLVSSGFVTGERGGGRGWGRHLPNIYTFFHAE